MSFPRAHLEDRFPEPHPLCKCPPVTFTSGPTAEQTEDCRRASHGITHPIVTLADIQEFLKEADRA